MKIVALRVTKVGASVEITPVVQVGRTRTYGRGKLISRTALETGRDDFIRSFVKERDDNTLFTNRGDIGGLDDN